MVQIIDRRSKALGGQNNTRSKSAIEEIAWHYTATTNSSIDNHERFWRNNRGWRRGGYHFYIDRDGNIFQNYNLETVSNGVAGHNSRIVNVCCEASRADNYTQAQIDARHELTVWLMDELNIKATNVKQHGEFPGASTSCAGYTKAQMNEFRAKLAGGKVSTQSTVKKPVQPTKQASTGGSIVDYLNSKKINSSFANRKKLAREYLGISNYTGTAKQNIDLLNAMRSGKKKAQPKATNNNVSNYKGGSIVDYLNLSGNKHLGGSSFNNRKKLAEANGIRGYTGTAAQNKQLLLKLQGGSVATPTRNVNVNAIAEQIKKGIDSRGRRIPNGHEPRRKHFGLTASEYAKVRARVNQIM